MGRIEGYTLTFHNNNKKKEKRKEKTFGQIFASKSVGGITRKTMQVENAYEVWESYTNTDNDI